MLIIRIEGTSKKCGPKFQTEVKQSYLTIPKLISYTGTRVSFGNRVQYLLIPKSKISTTFKTEFLLYVRYFRMKQFANNVVWQKKMYARHKCWLTTSCRYFLYQHENPIYGFKMYRLSVLRRMIFQKPCFFSIESHKNMFL